MQVMSSQITKEDIKLIAFLVFCHNFSSFIPLVVNTCIKMYLIIKV